MYGDSIISCYGQNTTLTSRAESEKDTGPDAQISPGRQMSRRGHRLELAHLQHSVTRPAFAASGFVPTRPLSALLFSSGTLRPLLTEDWESGLRLLLRARVFESRIVGLVHLPTLPDHSRITVPLDGTPHIIANRLPTSTSQPGVAGAAGSSLLLGQAPRGPRDAPGCVLAAASNPTSSAPWRIDGGVVRLIQSRSVPGFPCSETGPQQTVGSFFDSPTALASSQGRYVRVFHPAAFGETSRSTARPDIAISPVPGRIRPSSLASTSCVCISDASPSKKPTRHWSTGSGSRPPPLSCYQAQHSRTAQYVQYFGLLQHVGQ